ncbi:PKD domain-containing protein [Glaciibacter flavus]|uniref:PKD domain-containing protein n=1 Tax=Orlajensenia flava TaxID=2565934 RepID=UPI003AFFF5E2
MTFIATGALVAAASVVVAPAASADPWSWSGADPQTVSADPLPTVQIDGVVWSQSIVGDTVYVGGEFQNARPAGAAAGTSQTSRSNLLAYTLSTGNLIGSWNPGANAEIRSVAKSPDGSRVYIGGSFTAAGGQTRYRIAAFNTATGALISNWAPVVNGTVHTIAATNTAVYFAGAFTQVGSSARANAAAVDATTGAVLPFAPVLAGGYGAKGIVVSPDGSKIVIDGSFESANGSTNPGRGIAAFDTTGALLPWAMNNVLRNAGTKAGFISLTADNDSVYGSGWDYGGTSQDGFEGAFRANWSDGSLAWMEDCHGDTYSVFPMNGAVYQAGHSHYCGNIGAFPQTEPTWTLHHSLSFSKAPTGQLITSDPYGYRSFTGQQAPTLLHWFPDWANGSYTSSGQAGWTITGNGNYLLYGGEFRGVAGKQQQGLVRFAVKSAAPNKIGPRVQSTAWVLSGSSVRDGEIRLRWPANYDPDDSALTYKLFRRDLGTTTPISQTTLNSNFWTRPSMSYADKTVVPGTTYQYLIKASDPNGNTTSSEWTTFTASTGVSSNAYDDAVLKDNPVHYWPLGEASGSAAYDWGAGASDLSVGSGGTRNVAGQLQGGSSTATRFDGSNSGRGVSAVSEAGAPTVSVEAWFKTTSTQGGKIVGFGSSSNTSDSGGYDRQIYLDSSGRVVFGVYPNEVRTVTSPSSYRDGQWHQVVATLGPAGQALYVDGARVGQRSDTTSAQPYTGYWHVGGDNLTGWPGVGSFNLDGTIANVAIYDNALTSSTVNAHWVASGRTSVVPAAPSDAYGKAVYNLGPDAYWRLNETSGTTVADAGPNGNTATYSGPITKGVTGALSGVNNRAAQFAPTQNGDGSWNGGLVASQNSWVNPTTFALETWFNTTTTAGGKIIGFGSNRTGESDHFDRHVYMSPDGRLNFGAWTGAAQVVTSPNAYNNGQWHHVVAQMSSAGMRLYVDGQLVGSNANTQAENYTGYWRVGGDSGWDGATYFAGTIDEVAVYSGTLTAAQVLDHYSLGAFGAVNQAPTAAFTVGSPTNLQVSLDGTASVDPDGTIARFDWNYGDNSPVDHGATASHTYSASGTYTVTLTVTDDRGAQSSVQHQVSVVAPNQLPTAVIAKTATNLSVAFDGSGSTDPDGTIASYAWSFGDGKTSTQVAPTNVYATAGTYTVTLKVTDNKGGTNTASGTVTVSAPANAAPSAVIAAPSVSGLSASVSGSGSSDPDGSIVSYGWDWGDSSAAGSGVTASHPYASAGTYTVTLTVTDDKGATGVASVPVTVTAPTPALLGSDDFGRTVASGWGTADAGGAWTYSSGAASRFSVADGVGYLNSPVGTFQASLASVSATNALVSAEFSVDKVLEGHYIALVGRQVGTSQYLARLRLSADGSARLYLLQDSNALTSSLLVPGLTITPGEKYMLAVQVTGSGPTTVSAKVWKESAAEPAAWQLTATNTFAGLQGAGYPGIFSYLPGGVSASAPVKIAFDKIRITDPTAG